MKKLIDLIWYLIPVVWVCIVMLGVFWFFDRWAALNKTPHVGEIWEMDKMGDPFDTAPSIKIEITSVKGDYYQYRFVGMSSLRSDPVSQLRIYHKVK